MASSTQSFRLPKIEKLRKYELIYILQPEVTDEGRAKLEGRINEVYESEKIQIVKREEWGKRKLAYEIKHTPSGTDCSKGIYFYTVFAALPGVTQEIERRLRLNDDCIRFMTIKLDEDYSLEAALAEAGAPESDAKEAAANA
ncbi:MAG: 30S ribosomal protein S6 [Bradymonadia bacterium]